MQTGFVDELAEKLIFVGRQAKTDAAQPNLIEVILIQDHTDLVRSGNAKVAGDLGTFLKGLIHDTHFLQGNANGYTVPRQVCCAMFAATDPATVIEPRQHNDAVTHSASTSLEHKKMGLVVELPT
jgi:hypothetical protein